MSTQAANTTSVRTSIVVKASVERAFEVYTQELDRWWPPDHHLLSAELAKELPVSRPAVSQHLKVLKEAGLVFDRAVGSRRIYGIDPDGVAVLRAYLDRFWPRALAAFKEAVESDPEEVT